MLVVDDDEASRDILTAHLESSHARVLTAHSARAALDMLARGPVDVMLADIGMPEEDGYSLIRRVRQLPREEQSALPAAALTAFAREEDRRQALDAGFHLHFTKPIDAESLIVAVTALRQLSAV